MSPLKLGIVGAGRIAQTYAQVLAQCRQVEVVAVADTDPLASAALAGKLSCPSFDSHQALAEGAQVEAVLI
ncbi:MAG: Gfo/Idh/MocA family oxidoreductase, partial [Acidimicrobiia bacterium]